MKVTVKEVRSEKEIDLSFFCKSIARKPNAGEITISPKK